MLREIYEVKRTGKLDRLKLREDTLSDPLDSEIQIKIHAIGLNFADIFAIFGLYSATPKTPFIPGLEYSGVVIAKGRSVKGIKLGDKVMGCTRFGAYSTALNVDSRYVLPLPKKWSYEEGAAFITQALTAFYALKTLGDIKKNQIVMIHSAAGGVGILANRIAKKYGAKTIGVVGDKSKLDVLKNEGYDHSIVRSDDFRSESIKILDNRPLSLVLECIGGQIFKDSYDLLAPTGRLITYGSANFTPTSKALNLFTLLIRYINRPKIDPLKMISENKSVMGFNLIWLWDQVDELQKHLNELIKLSLKPQMIGSVYTWNELPLALEKFQSGKSIGKVVIRL
ncbi:synaptic vesicle VAT-1 family membrane protein [Leptospira sp. GIMC2001]|uniref:synaptic vesicle VAT-1 family membrane protein n=1 Tax=Leptospira sp. GIMC2001 TaxID=1513297 RepID=UPI0004A5C39E|nr:medium chain dehydrogenase/reductase family protein [Leptospira sp. GIMC2001]AID56187.1 zinc-binding dehydrogenase family protein [Leptospira sp. GIMC2001]WCL49684.1 medium chain dehydrogenase/reductase family protein [Leptospira sp. GIMC2001]